MLKLHVAMNWTLAVICALFLLFYAAGTVRLEPVSLVPFAFGLGFAGNVAALMRADTELDRFSFGIVAFVMLVAAVWWSAANLI